MNEGRAFVCCGGGAIACAKTPFFGLEVACSVTTVEAGVGSAAVGFGLSSGGSCEAVYNAPFGGLG
jgi:hypothetical protein